MIPVFETISVALKSNNLTSNDIDENLVNKINSKYYTFDDFINIKSAKKLLIFSIPMLMVMNATQTD